MDRVASRHPKRFSVGVDPANGDTDSELSRLRRENRQLRLEADSLRQTAQLVLDEPDTGRLAQALAQRFGRLMNATGACITVLQDGETMAHESWNEFRPSPSSAATVSRRLQTTISPVSGGCYEISTPILDHQHRLLGMLQAPSATAFSVDHIRIAEAFAIQAAIGLERARLFDRMRDWTRSLEMLLSFNAVINQHIEPAQLVRRLVENAAQFLQADGGRTGLALSSGSTGSVMISDAYWHRGHWHERHGQWETGQGIPGFLLESEFSYISNEYAEDRLADRSLLEEFDVRRALCVPIKNMDETLLGFFELLRGTDGPSFTWQDAAFLESLSNTTAVAIHNAQLVKSLEINKEQIRALSANHVQRLEAERAHIARELHDEAGQVLIGIKLGLQVLARTVPAEPPELRSNLDLLRELVNKSTVQIKDLARRLRPPVLDQLGLNVALRQMATDFTDRSRVPVDCSLEELPERLPPDTETALYRIAQEALTNVARHAAAHHVQFALRREGNSLQFCMQDDGVGFNQRAVGAGLGLLGMRERADMLGAAFSVDTIPGEGTEVTVTIPYECTDHPG